LRPLDKGVIENVNHREWKVGAAIGTEFDFADDDFDGIGVRFATWPELGDI
jgi:hypothetical protein